MIDQNGKIALNILEEIENEYNYKNQQSYVKNEDEQKLDPIEFNETRGNSKISNINDITFDSHDAFSNILVSLNQEQKLSTSKEIEDNRIEYFGQFKENNEYNKFTLQFIFYISFCKKKVDLERLFKKMQKIIMQDMNIYMNESNQLEQACTDYYLNELHQEFQDIPHSKKIQQQQQEIPFQLALQRLFQILIKNKYQLNLNSVEEEQEYLNRGSWIFNYFIKDYLKESNYDSKIINYFSADNKCYYGLTKEQYQTYQDYLRDQQSDSKLKASDYSIPKEQEELLQSNNNSVGIIIPINSIYSNNKFYISNDNNKNNNNETRSYDQNSQIQSEVCLYNGNDEDNNNN